MIGGYTRYEDQSTDLLDVSRLESSVLTGNRRLGQVVYCNYSFLSCLVSSYHVSTVLDKLSRQHRIRPTQPPRSLRTVDILAHSFSDATFHSLYFLTAEWTEPRVYLDRGVGVGVGVGDKSQCSLCSP
jgi:hypothetical protein